MIIWVDSFKTSLLPVTWLLFIIVFSVSNMIIFIGYASNSRVGALAVRVWIRARSTGCCNYLRTDVGYYRRQTETLRLRSITAILNWIWIIWFITDIDAVLALRPPAVLQYPPPAQVSLKWTMNKIFQFNINFIYIIVIAKVCRLLYFDTLNLILYQKSCKIGFRHINQAHIKSNAQFFNKSRKDSMSIEGVL